MDRVTRDLNEFIHNNDKFEIEFEQNKQEYLINIYDYASELLLNPAQMIKEGVCGDWQNDSIEFFSGLFLHKKANFETLPKSFIRDLATYVCDSLGMNVDNFEEFDLKKG